MRAGDALIWRGEQNYSLICVIFVWLLLGYLRTKRGFLALHFLMIWILFILQSRLEKLYGGKAYVGLRIPDADSGSRQTIDMVLVTKG